jgi:hypothetical protein
MVNDPKDIALAIKTTRSPTAKADTETNGDNEELESTSTGVAMSEDDMEDMFNELGLELVDETAVLEEDDERRECQRGNPKPKETKSILWRIRGSNTQQYHRWRRSAKRS